MCPLNVCLLLQDDCVTPMTAAMDADIKLGTAPEYKIMINEMNPDGLSQHDIRFVLSLTEALNEKDFIIALRPDEVSKYKYRYEGNGDESAISWIVNAKFNSNSNCLELDNPKESLLIKNE